MKCKSKKNLTFFFEKKKVSKEKALENRFKLPIKTQDT